MTDLTHAAGFATGAQPLRPAVVRRAHALRRSRSPTRTTSCSRSGSSSSACRSTTSSANDVMAQLLVLESTDPDRDILIYINSPGRLVHRADRDLRHDAVRPARHPDRLPRPGRLRRRGAAGRRHPGQADRAAELADPDPPAGHRGRLRPGLATSRSRPTRSCGCARCWRRCSRGTPAQPMEKVRKRHRARQDPHRRRGQGVRPRRRGHRAAARRPRSSAPGELSAPQCSASAAGSRYDWHDP